MKLKSLITEQEFKAKSKETGRVVVYKSKDSMDKAIKGGTAEPLDKKTSDKSGSGKPEKVKGADLFKKIDVVGKDKIELGTKIKDGKIKSSGPQRFADDVKDMKGEYDLDGGVKIKDGKMFNADGEEMDADDIEDFYYQDAYDGKGINVGIDIKQKESEWSEEDEEGYITNLKTGEREYVRENKIKLKSLLKETKVWERKFGEPLPTFSSVMEKHSGKKIDEQGILSKRAGINVFGDKKLELIAKSLINTAKDLHHTAKRKDEKNFDDVLSRITISLGVIRSYLNKPKRSM